MAKRIVSIDALRGFSIFMMIFFHVFVNSSKFMDADPFGGGIGILILFVFVFLFAHFRGYFVLISAIANVYTITKNVKKGKSLGKMLIRQLGVGFFLVIFGHLKDTFINQWGILRDWYLAGGFSAVNFDWAGTFETKWQLGIISEAVQSIGWCIILTSTIYIILLKVNGPDKVKLNALGLFIAAVIVLYVAAPIQVAVGNALGYPIYTGADPWKLGERDWWVNIYLYLAYDLAGAEAPIFPMLAYSLFGAIIGVFLTKDQLSLKFIRLGGLAGLVMILWGGAEFIIKLLFFGMAFDPFFHVHPSWYVLVASGIQVEVVLITLRMFEFNRKMTPEKLKKRTQYLRRWALFSLTIYSLQILEYIPRYFIAWVAPESNLFEWNEAPFIWVFVFMFFNWAMWEIIVRLWEKLRMYGTFEWLLLVIAKGRKGLDKKDPMNIQGSLYDCEPVMFLGQS